MAASANSSRSNPQETNSLLFRHQIVTSICITILGSITTIYLTQIYRKPLDKIDVWEILANLAIPGMLWIVTRIVLAYMNDVTLNIRHLRASVSADTLAAVSDVTTITNSALNSIREDMSNSLKDVKNTIAKTYYKGFYNLLSDGSPKDHFERFETLMNIAGRDSPLRGVVLDFVVRSLSSIGENGFAMVDAGVDIYVKYIAETVEKSKQVVMTCVVRPYWFVVDEIQGVSLVPYQDTTGKYGKGEHLRLFKEGTSDGNKYQRWMIVNEHMLAEMFLTAYIDKYFVEMTKTSCPVCEVCESSIAIRCPFHNGRLKEDGIDDIPEILWFKNEVNQKTVQLIYTLVRAERRHEELEDRVFISEHQPFLDIRFTFTNLENGILRIRWGDKAEPLAYVDKFNARIDPKTGKDKPGAGHQFYKRFRDILKIDAKRKRIMKADLQTLKNQLDVQLTMDPGDTNTKFKTNVNNISGQGSPETRHLLANGQTPFAEHIIAAADTLIADIDDPAQTLVAIYDSLIAFYANEGIPEAAYVVVHDPIHPQYPLRVARWRTNWAGILNAAD